MGGMLDLKAKLASAGLVTKEDIERAEKEKRRAKNKGRGKGRSGPPAPAHLGLPVQKLRDAPKAEQYETIRRWIEKVRLDPAEAVPSDSAKTFHFARANGKIGKLMLEPDLIERLKKGSAGLVSYMSNHGLAHAVVPTEGAKAVAEIFPLWLRLLEGDERAGQIEKSARG